MENSSSGFKVRISSMFKSSFGSCSSKNINDVAFEKPQNDRNRQHYQLIELFSPKPPRPFPSICKPKCSECPQTEEGYQLSNSLPRSKISERQHLLVPAEADYDGQKVPPVSPLNSLCAFQECKAQTTKPKERKRIKKTNSAKKSRPRSKSRCEIADFPGFKYNGLFSSDEEDEDEDRTTLFSSRSLSSDSSESFRRRNNASRRKRAAAKEPRQNPQEARVKGSLAVVKRSSDPYNDFRTSMVEMIVEKHIFSSKDLENMLQCFLALNSYHHHRIIIEVFTEIYEALFSNWS